MEAGASSSDVNDALCPRQVGASHAVAEVMSYALTTNGHHKWLRQHCLAPATARYL
jgi:hypothetical protein